MTNKLHLNLIFLHQAVSPRAVRKSFSGVAMWVVPRLPSSSARFAETALQDCLGTEPGLKHVTAEPIAIQPIWTYLSSPFVLVDRWTMAGSEPSLAMSWPTDMMIGVRSAIVSKTPKTHSNPTIFFFLFQSAAHSIHIQTFHKLCEIQSWHLHISIISADKWRLYILPVSRAALWTVKLSCFHANAAPCSLSDAMVYVLRGPIWSSREPQTVVDEGVIQEVSDESRMHREPLR